MRALKYYNEQLYVSRYGNAYLVRQVGEYMYQVKDLIRNKMLQNGRLFTIEEVKYIFCENVYRVKDLINIYDCAKAHAEREK